MCTYIYMHTYIYRGPLPPDCRPLLVHSLLGTGPHSRRWAAGEGAKLHLPLPIAPHHSHYCLNHPPLPVCGKIVFHKTGPWCQKGWGPLYVYIRVHIYIYLYALTYTQKLTLEQLKGYGANPLHSQKSPYNLWLALHIHGSVFTDSTSCGSCSTMVSTTEKKSKYRWTLPVQTHAVQGWIERERQIS